jgi:lysophospholipase L1-like esterase
MSLSSSWITAWASAIQGPYPFGTHDQQRRLHRAFPPDCRDAGDLTFRIIARPEFLGPTIRLRFSNIVSPRPLAIGGVHVGLQDRGATLICGSNVSVLFEGRNKAIIPPGHSLWSDPVAINPAAATMLSPALAVSFHVPPHFGDIGWHSEAFVTSYVSPSGAGSIGRDEEGYGFSETTTGRFCLDTIDVAVQAEIKLVAAFGDSITAGTGSTVDGYDRWTDIVSSRLRRRYGNRVAVINLGIGGNQVIGPADYDRVHPPFAGGRPAVSRLEEDLFCLSGLSAVIWMEGINDLGSAGARADAVFAGMESGVRRIREVRPSMKVIGGTVTPSLGSEGPYGSPAVDSERRRLNGLIRKADCFDWVIDFEHAVIDPDTGGFQKGLALGDISPEPGDRFHPSRAGHLAMGTCVDLEKLRAVVGF